LRLPAKVAAIAVVSSAVAITTGQAAFAAGMDPTPERLVLQPPGLMNGHTCQRIAEDPQGTVMQPPYKDATPNQFPCSPDNVAWANMMSELGFAIAPTAFHPARTTGYGGFSLSLEMSLTHINADQLSTAIDGTRRQYWHDGTQGAVDPNTKQYSIVNNRPDSLIQVYQLKARKGLPYGFEVTGALGYLANTTLWTGGADVRWSVLEGFRTGFLGYLPDVAVGGGVRSVTGSSKFFLTAVGLDAQISKPIPLADSAVLTPYVGYQRLWIFADSTIVDLTPNVDPLKQCGWAGNDPVSGAPLCRNKLTTQAGAQIDNNGDFNNNQTFAKARIQRNRGIVGVNYRYEVLWVGGQFLMDLTAPSDENQALLAGDKQWTM
jgi:hypothetical protein